MRPTGSRVSTARLALRRAQSDAAAIVLLALLTGLVALTGATVPRAVAATAAADLATSVSSLSVPTRDLSAVLTTLPATSVWPDPSYEGIYGILDDSIARIRAAADEPLHSAMGDAEAAIVAKDPVAIVPADAARAPGDLAVRFTADPAGTPRVTYVAGAAPASWVFPERAADAESDLGSGAVEMGLTGPQPDVAAKATSAHPFEFSLAKDAAEAMRLRVGDELDGPLGVMRLSGVFDLVDPADEYWQHVTGVPTAAITYPTNDTPLYTATAVVNPLSVGTLLMAGQFELYTRFWWSVDPAAVTSENAAGMSAAVHRFTQTLFPLAVPDGFASRSVTVASALADAIDTSRGRMGATLAVLALCLAGPIGAVLAVFALAARAVALRRAAATALVIARGARARDVRVLAGVEGVVIGLPIALIAAVLGSALIPRAGPGDAGGSLGGIDIAGIDIGGVDVVGTLLAVLIGLLPAAFFALTAVDGRGLLLTRHDVSPLARGRVRLAFEIGVIVLAGLATVLLVRRGTASGAAFDPLLTLAPLLLALAMSVLALRVLPLLLQAAGRIARRGRGLVAFVGTARATREPALGVAAVLALVMGIAVALFASAALTTVDRTAQSAAHAAVGADIRASGALFTPVAIDAVSAVPGVASVASIATASSLRLAAAAGGSASGKSVTVLVADVATLRAQHPELPDTLGQKSDGRIPLVVSSDLAASDSLFAGSALGAPARLGIDDAVVAGVAEPATDLGADRDWVLVDKAFAADVGLRRFGPSTLLIQADAGVDIARVAEGVRAALPGVRVDDAAAARVATEAAPSSLALRMVLGASALTGILLAALALFVASVSAAPARARTVGTLRTMGMSLRPTLGLVAWEIVPATVIAALTGTVLGLALPWLILVGADLGPFTGGASPAAPLYDTAQLCVVVGCFLAAAAVATALAVIVARRASPATTVKMGEE